MSTSSLSSFSLARSGLALALAASLVLVGFTFIKPAAADQDPALCNSNGVGLSLTVFRADGTTPVGGGSIAPGETVKYQATLSHLGPPNCNYEGGTLSITTPDGVAHVVASPATPVVPLITVGSPFVSAQITYVADSAHVGIDNDFDSASDYSGGISHSGDQHDTASAHVDVAKAFAKASPGIETIPSAGGPIGTELNDTATVTGGFNPTGNVTFKLFQPSDTTCAGPEVFSQVDGAAPYTTGPGYTSLVAGIYRWTADYAGDANNNPASSGCQAEQVTVTQPLLIEKTVATSFDQKWNWTIDKSADQTGLLLAEGQSFDVNYTVTVNSASEVQNATVSGNITITNPAGNPTAHITDVTDSLSVGGDVTVVCPEGLPQDLAADSQLVCTYTKNLGAENTDQTNTATVISTGVDGASTGPVPVDFTTPTNVIDECIDVSDTNGSLGGLPAQVCAGVDTLPKSFNYTLTFGPDGGLGVDVPVACGENSHPNTASFATSDDANDTDAIGSDDWTVDVTVECIRGCTLTQGYWKTHNDSFKGGAPTDDNWELITPLAELSGFFTNDGSSYPVPGPNTPPFTWFSVFWTAPKGNVYYNLAHQYMAAKLNILNGAVAPANVIAAIASAEDLFDSTTPATAAGLKGAAKNTWTTLAGTLGSFNEGTIGPGHCDEQNPS